MNCQDTVKVLGGWSVCCEIVETLMYVLLSYFVYSSLHSTMYCCVSQCVIVMYTQQMSSLNFKCLNKRIELFGKILMHSARNQLRTYTHTVCTAHLMLTCAYICEILQNRPVITAHVIL